PDTVRPGGKFVMRNEPALVSAPCTVKPSEEIAVPTVPLTDELLTTKCVAPASECTAPSAAADTTAERSTCPSGELATSSSATAATRTTGVRCKNAMSSAPGTLSQRSRLVDAIAHAFDEARGLIF